MGATVLESGIPIRAGLHVYAHCLRGTPGGVALLAINNSRTQPASIELPTPAEQYTLAAQEPEGTPVQLNGQELKPDANDELPELQAARIQAGIIELAPAGITFLPVAGAENASCR